MTDLSRDAKALIRAAMGGDEPSAADRERALAAFRAPPAPLAPTSRPRLRRVRVTWALAALLGTFTLGAAAYYGVARSPASSPNGAPSASVAAPSRPAAPKQRPRSTSMSRSEQAALPAEREPAPAPSAAVAAPRAPAPASAAPPPLARELRLIERARDALLRKDYGAALSAAAEHAERHPNGVLGQERQAITALARCLGSGDVGAARRFVDTWPKSVFTPRMLRDCGLPSIDVPVTPDAGTH